MFKIKLSTNICKNILKPMLKNILKINSLKIDVYIYIYAKIFEIIWNCWSADELLLCETYIL